MTNWSTDAIRAQFPILRRQVQGHPLVYLDNAATTQKPQTVIDAIVEYYQNHNANVHRGVHTLGDESTQLYHQARVQIADFFGARDEELILTRNTTEGLNWLVSGWGESHVGANDVIVATLMEHHSNFVPWQRLALRRGARLVVAPLLDDGCLDWPALQHLIDEAGQRLRVLALTHIANTTGATNPVAEINEYLAAKAWRSQVLLVVDAAQSAARLPLNFTTLGVDALAFSGHKMYGPMGTGGLLVAKQRLSELEPVLVGGGMIGRVTLAETSYADSPQEKFTAGTPDVAGAVGLAAACTFLQKLGREAIARHDRELTADAYQKLAAVPEVTMVGPTPANSRQGSVAFLYQGVHAHDVAQVLDRWGVAVRSGYHCAMPLHDHFAWPPTTRASFGVYNTTAEIDTLVSALADVKKVFRGKHG